MNNYKFGDGGFSFVESVFDNIKFAWKPYAIIMIFTTVLPAVLAFIPASMIAFAALSGSSIMFGVGTIISLLCGIFSVILGLVGISAMVKCINDADIHMGHLPTASECLRFGFSKLGKLVVFGLLLIACMLILWIPLGMIIGLLTLVTLGIGVIVIVPAMICIVGYLYIILAIAVANLVIYDMGIIESITDAARKSVDGFKENILFGLKLLLINIIGAIVTGIIASVPILGWIAGIVIAGALNIGMVIAIMYRFFGEDTNEFDMY
ncbi:MAG: hypothetical protein RR620_05650 [Clostridium sp.]